MANPVLVAAAIVVPVLAIGVGGGYWYYKADRIVDEGTAGPYAWRVRRTDMKYTAEVESPGLSGFATGGFAPVPAPPGHVGPTELWETPEEAKAKALEFIAIAAAAAAQAQPAGVSVQADPADTQTASFQEDTTSTEMVAPVLTIAAVPQQVAFAGGM